MKNAAPEHEDDLRPEYERSDFGELVRGKYIEKLTEESVRYGTNASRRRSIVERRTR